MSTPDGEVDDLSFAKRELIKQCKELETKLQELRADAASSKSLESSLGIDLDSPSGQLFRLRQEELLLRENLACIQDCMPSMLPADEQVMRHHVLADLRSTVAALKGCVAGSEENINSLEKSLALHQIHSSHLATQAAQLSADTDTSHTPREQTQAACAGSSVGAVGAAGTSAKASRADDESQQRRMKTRYKAVETALAELLEEYFPEGGGETETAGMEKKPWHEEKWEMHFDQDSRPPRSLSMAQIIEELLKASFQTPDEPYVVTTKRHWAPYRHLLLNSGIAECHPTDKRRMRLVPMHMGLT